MRALKLTFAALVATTLFNSCKHEGCTDKSAVNYSVVADKDDGSCTYCETKTDHVSKITQQVVDDYYQSPHYGQQVLEVTFDQIRSTSNYSSCGDNGCGVDILIKNRTDQRISGRVYLSTSFTSSWTIDIDIPAGASITRSDLFNNSIYCSQIVHSNDCYADVNGTLQYN